MNFTAVHYTQSFVTCGFDISGFDCNIFPPEKQQVDFLQVHLPFETCFIVSVYSHPFTYWPPEGGFQKNKSWAGAHVVVALN